MGALKVLVLLLGLLYIWHDFPKVNGIDRSTGHLKTNWKVITYSFKITVYRAKFLKRQIAYSAGHSGSFNPAAITNHEAHMINGNMDSKKEHNRASNILGRKSGVGKKICEIQPKALLTHCHAHSLRLSVKDTTSDSKVLSDAMDISREIITLVICSP